MTDNRKALKRAKKKRMTAKKAEDRISTQRKELALREWVQRYSVELRPVFERMVERPAFSTPATIDERVLELCRVVSSSEPRFLECEPELWSRQSMCNVNVREFIRLHGGEMRCGYRIWYNGRDYAEAERHAIWVNGPIERDVSFCNEGETKTLFLPDSKHPTDFDANEPKFRMAFTDASRRALRWHEALWSLVSTRLKQFSDEEGWREMPSYEQWLAGARVANLQVRQDH